MLVRSWAAAGLLAASLTGSAAAQPATGAAAAPTAPADYKNDANWLCRPGRQDACTVDQTATVIQANGKMSREAFTPNANAPIDCFYVYPTVSTDRTANSDLVADDAERRVVEAQLARFGSQCRLFAPLYRQVTLTALRSGIAGQVMPGLDREVGYADVKAAWNDYLTRDNKGRGVVLIGHSQGSGVLRRLIKEEIDGKPVQDKLISAYLIGTGVAVPAGKDVGGDFKSIPLCRSRTQTGCLVSFASFRKESPPPANTRFGKVQGAGMQAACVNPAALTGGPATMKAYLAGRGRATPDSLNPATPEWVKGGKPADTPFVAAPGLLTAQCVNNEKGSYLEVTTNADPKDPRADVIAGDVVNNGVVAQDWGLHLIDMNVAMGDMVELVASQGRAWQAKRKAG